MRHFFRYTAVGAFATAAHYLVLVLLWLAFVAVSVGAFFAILFTGRYPRDEPEHVLTIARPERPDIGGTYTPRP